MKLLKHLIRINMKAVAENMISRVKKFGFNFNSISVEIVALFSVALLFIFSSFYATLIFIQFDFIKIIEVSICFLILFIALNFIFNRWVFSRINFSNLDIFSSIIVFIILILWLHAPDKWTYSYFRIFPLLDVELGLGWNPDSAFHVSLINSINLFGYPSTGQHGTPLLAYHVLSHYVDALIIKISNIDAWDSYGMFFYFKRVMVLGSIILFIASVCRKREPYVFFLSIVFLTPIILSTWHLVGSHSLWLTSNLVILSSPYVFKILNQEGRLSSNDYMLLMLLIILISFGKISSGFCYSMIIGFSLLLKDRKDYRVYFFGLILLLFFIIYASQFRADIVSTYNIIDLTKILNFIFLKSPTSYDLLFSNYVLIFILGLLAFFFRLQTLKNLFYVVCFSIVLIVVYFNVASNLTIDDKAYFSYGFFSVLIILIYQELVMVFQNGRMAKFPLIKFVNFLPIFYLKTVLLSCILFLLAKLPTAAPNVFNIGSFKSWNLTHNLNYQPFESLNLKYANYEISVLEQIGRYPLRDLAGYPNSYYQFRDSLLKFMSVVGTTPKTSLLFMPKDIFFQGTQSNDGLYWARGLFLYAFTGVPLIHGISYPEQKGYGNVNPFYNNQSVIKTESEFKEVAACSLNKDIVIVESFETRKFSFIRCNFHP
jgi:hypothetical protein